MLREADVDAVAVCLPNDLHAEVTIAALEAKKHVIVEKPMAVSLEQADAMLRAARANGRQLMVEQTQRFDPVHETAYDVLRSGRLGDLVRVHGRLGHAGPEYWSPTSPWFTVKSQSGGGVLMDVGIHIIDLLRWLSGKQVKRICAHAKTIRKLIEVEDNASALFEFTDGTIGAIEVSWTIRPYEVTTDSYAERGTVRTALGSATPVVVQFSQPDGSLMGEAFHPSVAPASRLGGAYPAFINALVQETQVPVPGEEGRSTLEVVLAAYESARTGRWIDLPLSSITGSSGRPGSKLSPEFCAPTAVPRPVGGMS